MVYFGWFGIRFCSEVWDAVNFVVGLLRRCLLGWLFGEVVGCGILLCIMFVFVLVLMICFVIVVSDLCLLFGLWVFDGALVYGFSCVFGWFMVVCLSAGYLRCRLFGFEFGCGCGYCCSACGSLQFSVGCCLLLLWLWMLLLDVVVWYLMCSWV